MIIEPTEIEFGYRPNSKTKWLIPVIRKWAVAITRYADTAKDAGYYYNERTNIGFLAAGAWLAKYCALEEYPDRKKHLRTGGSKSATKLPRTNKGTQRVDLYIFSKRNNAVLEAKMLWGEAGKMGSDAAMKAAIGDAKRDRGAEQKIACVFYAPHFPKKIKKPMKVGDKDIGAEIERWIAFNRDASNNIDLLAWCFPLRVRQIVGGGKYAKSYYPGIIMALKVV